MNDETGVQIVGARYKDHQDPGLIIFVPDPKSPLLALLDCHTSEPRAMDMTFGALSIGQRRKKPSLILRRSPKHPPQRILTRGSESRSSNPGRLPRFGRDILENIVDLEADEEEPTSNPTGGTSSSPEVQFVGSTTRRHPLPSRGLDPFSVQRSNLAPPNPRRRPVHTSMDDSMLSSIFSSVPSLLGRRSLARFPPPDVESLIFGSELLPESLDDLGQLNYAMSSFPMGSSTPQAPPSRRNEYKPPSPAPEGFTRTLGEEDVAVCPNCYWELGTGEGKKQEIWVAKQCGHVCWPLILQTILMLTLLLQVYCGECTDNRSLSKAKKAQGSPKTKPFSKCQVLDCGKSVSAPTSMVHIYL
ncbi:hypothetical protein N7481_012881 [Penicillium waksmanii]|uniref:uncharacterized protein n=1 Tax=Penicillium waksmanii TaxID=69791 RepID=UPI002546B34D|nr:uncharacterized protein N7481_012881 [Penicillium waksmanii]KAJ5966167.1 hypothetical protein N7481_012881 [Penicillium waksmanii]